jgi:mRNA interferase MazF
VQRGEIFALPGPRRARGHEQRGRRYGVVVQNDALLALSTATRVLVEQLSAVDPSRLGKPVGHLQHEELRDVDRALSVVLGLAP